MDVSPLIIGIDPGMEGATAFIWPYGNAEVFDYSDRTSLACLRVVADLWGPSFISAWVEQVGNNRVGGRKQGATSMFTFGRATGTPIGWLEAFAIPFQEVSPGNWQRLIFGKGLTRVKSQDRKNMSLDMARGLFPGLSGKLSRKKDHNRADALLIAHACKLSMVV